MIVNWFVPSERQESRLECRNVAEHNAITSSVKKRRNRNRQKSLPVEQQLQQQIQLQQQPLQQRAFDDDCVYVTDMQQQFYSFVPAETISIQHQPLPLSTNGFKPYSPPPPPLPPHFDVPEPAIASAHDGTCNVITDTCWQYEHRRRSKSCQRPNKKRKSIQAEAVQLEVEPLPHPPPPPIFCGGPEMYERVLPPPPQLQMMASCNDDIVAVVEDHRHEWIKLPKR